MLLWCYEGTATVNAPDRVLSVMEGDLVIAPQGAFYTAGATICEMDFGHLPATVGTTTRRIHLGARWSERMVAEFARNKFGVRRLSDEVRALIDAPVTAPIMPKSEAAHHVSQRLVEHPSDQTPLLDFAAELGVSSRTIQRQFQSETGLVFSEWRAGLRVFVAASLIGSGMTSTEAAAMVGFGATSSLTRAFKRHTGRTPGAKVRAGAVPSGIPGMTVYARTDVDQVLWMAKGTATVTTDGFCRFVGRGETITLPSGTAMRVDVAAGSIAIPIPLAECEGVNDTMSALRASSRVPGTFSVMTALEECNSTN